MSWRSTGGHRVVLLAACVLGAWVPEPVDAQAPETLVVRSSDAEDRTLAVHAERGFPVVAVEALQALGWAQEGPVGGDAVTLRHTSGIGLRLRVDSPLVDWNGRTVHLVDVPFRSGDDLYVPLQLVVDLLPGLRPDAYRFDHDEAVLLVVDADAPTGAAAETAFDNAGVDSSGAPAQGLFGDRDLGGAEPPAPFTPPGGEYDRLVVIDPGHGGHDDGGVGPGGEREKDVALSISLALAQELATRPGLEVRLTRNRDVSVPTWVRGEWATEWRGDRPAVFLSIHTNVLEDRTGIRGFETYFLAEARTDHERHVAAVENAMAGGAFESLDPDDPALFDLLRDVRAYEYQESSARLAQDVQSVLGDFHPGTDRGVRQAPLAVITNAGMPAVLVEIGFISNREEARAMSGVAFRRNASEAIARAVDRYFARYPEASSQ